MHAKSLQSCLTLRDPMDSSPPGSSNHRILQARILEWVAISFSIKNVWQVQKQNQKSCVACTQGKWRKTVWKPWMPCFRMWTLFPQPMERQQRLFLNKGNGVICALEQWNDPATLGWGNTVLSHSIMSDSLQPHGLWSARLLYPWGFSRQQCWSGLPWPSPEDLPNPGIKPTSPMSPALAGGFFTLSQSYTKGPWEARRTCNQWRH